MLKTSSSKPNISEYGFLRLFVSTVIIQGESPIFDNHQLQRDLYAFYDNPDFHFLFEDICKKESIDGNNYVDLVGAFQRAYAWGLLSMVQGKGNLRSIINIPEEEARKSVSEFESQQIEAMSDLVTQLYGKKNTNKQQVYFKK